MTGRILDGDNGGVSEATFTRHLNENIRLEKLASEVRAKQKAAKKAAEDDGVIVADMKAAIKIASEDAATVIERQNRVTQYTQWLKAPVGQQLQMLDMPPDQSKLSDDQRVQKWSDEGFQAGLIGKNRDTCPHDPNSEAGRAWFQGYEEGQERNLSGIKAPNGRPVTEAAKGATKKAGSKPKAASATPPAPANDEPAAAAAPPAPPAPSDDDDDDWERAAPSGDAA